MTSAEPSDADEPVLAAVAALAEIPAGPRLRAALAALPAALPGTTLTAFATVLVLQARYRQGNDERGQLMTAVTDVLALPMPDVPADRAAAYVEDEVRAALI